MTPSFFAFWNKFEPFRILLLLLKKVKNFFREYEIGYNTNKWQSMEMRVNYEVYRRVSIGYYRQLTSAMKNLLLKLLR